MRTPPKLSRLREGEWVVGVASLALVVVLFASPWFTVTLPGAPSGYGIGYNGWESFSILGPLALLVGLLGIAVWWLQATCRAPALPVCATVFEALLSLALVIGLLIRVLVDHPNPAGDSFHALVVLSHVGVRTQTSFAAYVGIVLALAALAGSYASLREDGGAQADATAEIEVVRLAGAGAT